MHYCRHYVLPKKKKEGSMPVATLSLSERLVPVSHNSACTRIRKRAWKDTPRWVLLEDADSSGC